jgi:hypothetical protein
MAKPNYKFDKRQRDIAKKKQQDEKRLKKLTKTDVKGPDDTSPGSPQDGVAAEANPSPDAAKE